MNALPYPSSLKTPILFLAFNRPNHTKRVFEKIRLSKPSRLYVAIDGAREGHDGEAEAVEEVKKIILNGIDWKCEVKTLFSEVNLGCKHAVSNAIDWFFDREDEGIILEDDCLPSESFFWFCEELLLKYRNDERVGMIGGFNFLEAKANCNDSYWFTRATPIWGWATWATRWKNYYDVEASDWPAIRDAGLAYAMIRDAANERDFTQGMNKVYEGQVDTWDAQWTLSCLSQNRLSIVPSKNLISNIGFDALATHTKGKNSFLENTEIFEINFPLIHPKWMVENYSYDVKVKEMLSMKKSSYRAVVEAPILLAKLLVRIILGDKYYQKLKIAFGKL
jgi:hypothetical protein